MSTMKWDGDVEVSGNIRLTGASSVISPSRPRVSLLQESLAKYPVPLNSFYISTTGQPLPAAASGANLGFYSQTYSTGTPIISTGDVKNTSSNMKARNVVPLPIEYVAGQTVIYRASAGMLTTVASASCTLTVEAYLLDRNGAVSGSNLVTTAATTINSLTFGDKDFQVTATALNPGDQLDIRLTVTWVDVATGTVVQASIGSFELLCDVRG